MRYDVDVSLSRDTCACAIVVRTSFFCWIIPARAHPSFKKFFCRIIPGNPQPCPEADMIRRDYLSTHSWHACSQLRLKRSVCTATDDHWGKLFGLWHACILATLSIARRSCKRTEFGLRSAVYVAICGDSFEFPACCARHVMQVHQQCFPAHSSHCICSIAADDMH